MTRAGKFAATSAFFGGEANVPPFVQVKTGGQDGAFVIVNFADPAQTRALYERLETAWRAAGGGQPTP